MITTPHVYACAPHQRWRRFIPFSLCASSKDGGRAAYPLIKLPHWRRENTRNSNRCVMNSPYQDGMPRRARSSRGIDCTRIPWLWAPDWTTKFALIGIVNPTRLAHISPFFVRLLGRILHNLLGHRTSYGMALGLTLPFNSWPTVRATSLFLIGDS